MCLWCFVRQVPRVHGQSPWHRSQPSQDLSPSWHVIPTKNQGSLEVERKNCSPEPFHFKSNRPLQTIFPSPSQRERLHLDSKLWTILSRSKSLSRPTSYTIQISRKGFIHLVLSDFERCYKFSFSAGRRQHSVALLLHKQVFAWYRDTVPGIENLALALIVAAWKLRSYFQAHIIVVTTKFPLKQVFQKPEASVHLAKWSIV